MLKIHQLFISVGIIFIVIIAFSIDSKNDNLDMGFANWKKNMVAQLEINGVSETTISSFKDSVKKDSAYLKNLDLSNPKSNVLGDAQKLIDDDLLLKSQVFYTNNKKLLADYGFTYNVEYSNIIAMLGIGSKFGENIGKYSVVNLLSNLSYSSPETDYYTNELIYFLKLVDRGDVDINIMGDKNGTFSYLGIMPSVYYLYGVDGDQDTRIDLFTSKEDILHTAFSLLRRLAWREGLPILTPITNTQSVNLSDQEGIKFLLFDKRSPVLTSDQDIRNNQSLQKSKTIEYWLDLGLKPNEPFNVSKDNVASLIMSSNNRTGVLLYNNFNLLFRGINVLDKSIAIGLLAIEVDKYVSLVNYKEKNVAGVPKTRYNVAKEPKKDDKPSAYAKYKYVK